MKIYKIGGNVIDNPASLARFVDEFAAVEGPKILVHGGGRESTRLSRRLGLETRMIDGRRVTDEATIDVVTMVYAGLVNKRIVAMLQARGCNAAG
ncbi:MAG: acetylglutamate kinase, partial [Clostridium sp.]|nr:acetylglutamate kinase [Clostridium sp.]